ncbi:hypothetical protein HZB04_02675 [Candidatus Wolfebacteria bacterium]|nr:hypothetical protein [Candidatus Wolfebacteria bacterium]
MESSFKTFFFIIFIGIIASGFFNTHAGMQNHYGGCVLAASQGTDCPNQVSSIDYFTFHVNAFKGFLIAVFSNNFFASLLFVLLIAGTVSKIFAGDLISSKLNFSYFWHKPELFKSYSKREFFRWLALHENSPSFFRALI